MKHIVMYSGGAGSYILSKRVIAKYGKENVILLFCDVLWEDEDLYRFNKDIEKKLDIKIVTVKDGRNPLELMEQTKVIYNSMIAGCSWILKKKPAAKWLKENYKTNEAILHFGIDFYELHRASKIANNYNYKCEFLLIDEKITKENILNELVDDGIELPRLYKMGFSHNNCGGRCIKGGQGHWINLLIKMPERFEAMANFEEKMQGIAKYSTGKTYTFLKKSKNGITSTYSLKQLKNDYLKKPKQINLFDIGGCGCFVEDDNIFEKQEKKGG